MRDLAVLIVNWNVRELLRACLTSVYTDLVPSRLEADVWIVDNASQDSSPEMVRAEFPQAHLVSSQENLGFGGGNNVALRQLGANDPPRFILLLNPDTELRPGALRVLFDFLEEHPQVGVAGARLLYRDGRFQHSAFRFPGLWQILFDLYPLPGYLYESRLNGRYPREWYERGDPFPADHPLGAAMMARWETIRQVGLFDEGFHMYCEEIDWCMRIKRKGWEIYCVPKAEIVHHQGQSTKQIREESFVSLWRSRRRLYDKHYGPIKNRLARRLVRACMKRKKSEVQRRAQRGELHDDEAASYSRALCQAMTFFE